MPTPNVSGKLGDVGKPGRVVEAGAIDAGRPLAAGEHFCCHSGLHSGHCIGGGQTERRCLDTPEGMMRPDAT